MLKKPTVFLGVLGLFVLLMSAGPAQAQYNPNGWIQTDGWNMLFPLGGPGCDGGGAGRMALNWVAPHVIGLENPKGSAPPTVWKDIAFGGAAQASNWGGTALAQNPTWFTTALLEASFAPLTAVPNGDVVDYQGMVDYVNTNLLPTLPPGTPALPGDNVVGLATTYVENLTGAPLPVVICSASDDSVQVWVNNLMVTNVSSCRGTAGDCAERFPALLPVGVSKIATLTWEGGGGWGFRLAIEVGGAKQTDASTSIKFIGPGVKATVGQVQYGATRSIAGDPFVCDNDTVNVRIVGNAAAGADGDAIAVVESVVDGLAANIAVDAPGATVEDIAPPPPPERFPVGVFADHRVVGTAPCGPASTTTVNDQGTADPLDDVYSSVSQTGRDLWDAGDANNDSIEFAYTRLQGDFDVAIKVVGKANTTATRWGKWGLMARWDYDRASRYTIMQDHSNDPQDPCRLAGRVAHLATGNMYEDLQGSGDPALDHPTYLRLKRTGTVVTGYISNDAGVESNPTGGPWYKVGRDDNWGAAAPATMLVGFANSQHNSGGCGIQTVDFKLIGVVANPVPTDDSSPIGKKITWNTTRGAVNAGLSYSVSTTGILGAAISGEVVGESFVAGPSAITLTAIPRTGPIGIFDDSHDIGVPPTLGKTTFDPATGVYDVFGSGGDIWDGGDAFQFAYKHVTGDFVATARIVSRDTVPGGYRWGRHGIMARWSCSNVSKYSLIAETLPTLGSPPYSEDWPRHQFRTTDGTAGGNNEGYQINDGVFLTEGRLPQWMRLVRVGREISTYLSEDANADGSPDNWIFVGSDLARNIPSTLLVGIYVQGRFEGGAHVRFDRVTITPPNDCYEFEPVAYETGATNTAGIGSRPYAPLQVKAQIPADLASAVAAGGSGLGVKNRNWIWTDLSVAGVNLAGTTQLLWNNENRTFANARLLYTFQSSARVYIAWDARLVKGGSDNPTGAELVNGWFDVTNDVGTLNAQGWLRIGNSAVVDPAADVIAVDADSNFARGGVWAKDVAPGDALAFLNTVPSSFTSGRSPYVVFVSCGQECAKGGLLSNLDYEGADDLGVVVVGGGFAPTVAGGKLQITNQSTGGSANAVWYGVPADPAAGGVPVLAEGFVAEFDAYMTWNGTGNPPADGMAFAVVATSQNDGLASAVAPFPPGLDIATVRGDGGGAMAYEGNNLYQRIEGHPSFAIEMDNWVGGGDNEPGDGGCNVLFPNWHAGVDVNFMISSRQTNVEFAVPTLDLPNIFNANGVHFEVLYKSTGDITVWVTGYDRADPPQLMPRKKILSYRIAPLPSGDVVMGFVGGTGGATCTQEVDNFALSSLCCEGPDAVKIVGPTEANQGSAASFSADFTGAGLGASVTYSWSAIGDATIATPNAATTNVTFNAPGKVTLKVVADDGGCSGIGASAEFEVTVIAQSCDLQVACGTPDKATGTVALTVTVGTNPTGCNCDNIVVRQGGTELYRGPVAGLQPLPLPADCCDPTQAKYDVACVGPLGEGPVASCSVTCLKCGTPFIRGDCNQDGQVCGSVSDMVRMCEILFLGAATTTCPAACDANGDGTFGGEVTDILYLANFCFTGQNAAPPAPYPACGIVEDLPEDQCVAPTHCEP